MRNNGESLRIELRGKRALVLNEKRNRATLNSRWHRLFRVKSQKSKKDEARFAAKAADSAMRKGNRSALRVEEHEKGEPMGFPRQLNRAAGAVGCICPLNPMSGKQPGEGRSQKIISATGARVPLCGRRRPRRRLARRLLRAGKRAGSRGGHHRC